MCLSKKHVDYLERTNEADYRQGRISYETFIQFCDVLDQCRACELCDNGCYGDIRSECRLLLLRVFVSMKRDNEGLIAGRPIKGTP